MPRPTFWQRSRALRKKRAAMKHSIGLCQTPFCRKRVRKHRRFCNTCRNRKYDDSLRRLFRNLKSSAKRRGKAFALSWDYFCDLVISTGYDINHGNGASDLHIDRINPDLGYVEGNLQVITCSENSRKRWAEANGWRP